MTPIKIIVLLILTIGLISVMKKPLKKSLRKTVLYFINRSVDFFFDRLPNESLKQLVQKNTGLSEAAEYELVRREVFGE